MQRQQHDTYALIIRLNDTKGESAAAATPAALASAAAPGAPLLWRREFLLRAPAPPSSSTLLRRRRAAGRSTPCCTSSASTIGGAYRRRPRSPGRRSAAKKSSSDAADRSGAAASDPALPRHISHSPPEKGPPPLRRHRCAGPASLRHAALCANSAPSPDACWHTINPRDSHCCARSVARLWRRPDRHALALHAEVIPILRSCGSSV